MFEKSYQKESISRGEKTEEIVFDGQSPPHEVYDDQRNETSDQSRISGQKLFASRCV